MAEETPGKLNLRAEYTALTEKAFQFTLFRIPILLTIILLMYNNVNDDRFKQIMAKYKDVQNLSDISWDIAYTGDWYVDHMFDDHGLSGLDSGQYYRTVYNQESQIYQKYPAADSIFEAVPHFLFPLQVQLHDDTSRANIQRHIGHVRTALPESKKPAFEAWVVSFQQAYNAERCRDSLYWLQAFHEDSVTSARMHRKAGIDSNLTSNYYRLAELRRDTVSQVSNVVGPSEVPMRNTLFSLLGQPNRRDMAIAHQKQQADLSYIQKNIAASFSMKLPFLGDTPLNFQYWIFVLPVVMILSLIYLVILRSKIGIIEQLSAQLNEPGGPDDLRTGDALTAYHQQPYRTFSKIFDYLEVALWALFLYIFSYVLINFHGFVGDILKGTAIAIYFALIYCQKIVFDLRRCSLHEPRPPRLYRIWSVASRVLTRVFRYRSRRPVLIVGNLFIALTLVLIMCFGGCRSESAIHQKFTLPNGRVLTEEQMIKKVGNIRSIEGLDLILNYKTMVWDYGAGGMLPNRFFQIGYICAVLGMLAYLVLAVQEKLWKKNRWSFRFKHGMLIFFSLLLIEFTICFAAPFTDLYVTLAMILLMAGFWWWKNRLVIFAAGGESTYRQLGRSLLLVLLPFFILCVPRNLYQLAHLIPITLLGENKQLLFYGLTLMVTGLLTALQTEKLIVAQTGSVAVRRPSRLLPLVRSWSRRWAGIKERLGPLGRSWKYAFFAYLILLYESSFVFIAWPDYLAYPHLSLADLVSALIYFVVAFPLYLFYLVGFWLVVTLIAVFLHKPPLQKVLCFLIGSGLIALAARKGMAGSFEWHRLLCGLALLLLWVIFARFPVGRPAEVPAVAPEPDVDANQSV
jgi:hypothetical protein